MKKNESSAYALSVDQKVRVLESMTEAQSTEVEEIQQKFPKSGNVRAKQSAKYLSIGVSTWWLWVKQGRVRPPIKHGSRVSVWEAEYVRSLAKNGVPEVA